MTRQEQGTDQMAKFFSPGRPNLEAASLQNAAEIYGQMICRPIAYGDAATIAALPDINTLISATGTGYTQGGGMVFSLRFENSIPADGNDDPREVLIFIGTRK